VLLATSDTIDSTTARKFDSAIEACSMGYATAASGLAHLTPIVMPPPADAGTDAAVVTDATSDATNDTFTAPRITAGGGCGCRVADSTRRSSREGAFALAAMAAGLAWSSRRRRRTTRIG
jgi:MYXO-CTERM domain-containing protein